MRILSAAPLLIAFGLCTANLDGQVVLGPPIVNPSIAEALPRVADWNGDGLPDLLELYAGGTALRFGDGRGHFTAPVATQPQLGLDGMDAGDVDGDGRPDIVGMRSWPPSTEVYVLLGLGGVQFDFAALYPVAGSASLGGGLRLADADGDGDLDALVIAGTSGAQKEALLLTNDGTGHFASQVITTGPFLGVPFAADLNADDWPDVIQFLGAPFGGPQSTRILLGQPGGGFATAVEWADAIPLGVADLDLDGRLDVLTSETTLNGAVEAHLGQGDGSFADGPVTPLPGDILNFAIQPLADFDGDGVPDLLVKFGNPQGHEAIRRGDGHGGFASTDAVDFQANPQDLVIADVIPDGRPDIVTTAELPGQPFVLLVTLSNLTYAAGGPLLDLGHAKVGVKGFPILIASGDFTGGSVAEFQLFLGLPNATTVLIAGLSEGFAPFHGGTLVPSPDVVIGPMTSDAQGGVVLAGHWADGVPSGTSVTLQFWTTAPGFPTQYAASTAVRVTTP